MPTAGAPPPRISRRCCRRWYPCCGRRQACRRPAPRRCEERRAPLQPPPRGAAPAPGAPDLTTPSPVARLKYRLLGQPWLPRAVASHLTCLQSCTTFMCHPCRHLQATPLAASAAPGAPLHDVWGRQPESHNSRGRARLHTARLTERCWRPRGGAPAPRRAAEAGRQEQPTPPPPKGPLPRHAQRPPQAPRRCWRILRGGTRSAAPRRRRPPRAVPAPRSTASAGGHPVGGLQHLVHHSLDPRSLAVRLTPPAR